MSALDGLLPHTIEDEADGGRVDRTVHRFAQAPDALPQVIEAFRTAFLNGPDYPRILQDMGDGVVSVRVAFLADGDCGALTSPSPADPSVYPGLDPAAALGCAFSCPFEPDSIVGPITLSLDTTGVECVEAVAFCAGAPADLSQL